MAKEIAVTNRLVNRSILPGFRLTLTFTLAYLALIVLVPLSGLFFKTTTMSFSEFVTAVTSDRVMHAYEISFGASFIAALIDALFGLIVAWVLVRYRFFGRRVIDAIVDLPFALPTAIAGIALTALYAPEGWIGQFFKPWGLKIAFTPLGIVIAMIFVGLPFVVRTIQPVLADMEKDTEEAAVCLGASRWQTFSRVVLPQIIPAMLTGSTMAFARALGEYGSVIFIAGNMPGVSEIVPLVIVIKLEQYDYQGASAIALVMLLASFILLFVINMLQKWNRQRRKRQ